MCRFSRDVSRDITFSTTRASNSNVRVMPKSALHHITHQPQHITWPGHMFQSAPPVSCFHLIITGIYVPLFLNLFVKLLLLFMLSCSCVTKYSVILLMFCLFSPVSPFCVSSFLTILVTSLHFLKIKSALHPAPLVYVTVTTRDRVPRVYSSFVLKWKCENKETAISNKILTCV